MYHLSTLSVKGLLFKNTTRKHNKNFTKHWRTNISIQQHISSMYVPEIWGHCPSHLTPHHFFLGKFENQALVPFRLISFHLLQSLQSVWLLPHLKWCWLFERTSVPWSTYLWLLAAFNWIRISPALPLFPPVLFLVTTLHGLIVWRLHHLSSTS